MDGAWIGGSLTGRRTAKERFVRGEEDEPTIDGSLEHSQSLQARAQTDDRDAGPSVAAQPIVRPVVRNLNGDLAPTEHRPRQPRRASAELMRASVNGCAKVGAQHQRVP